MSKPISLDRSLENGKLKLRFPAIVPPLCHSFDKKESSSLKGLFKIKEITPLSALVKSTSAKRVVPTLSIVSTAENSCIPNVLPSKTLMLVSAPLRCTLPLASLTNGHPSRYLTRRSL